ELQRRKRDRRERAPLPDDGERGGAHARGAARGRVARLLRLALVDGRAAGVRRHLLPQPPAPRRRRRPAGLRRRRRAVRRRPVAERPRPEERPLPLRRADDAPPAGRARAAVRRACGYRRFLSAARRSTGTFTTASRKIARLIFEWPAVRSTKRIGTSTTRKPFWSVRYVPSIWNA